MGYRSSARMSILSNRNEMRETNLTPIVKVYVELVSPRVHLTLSWVSSFVLMQLLVIFLFDNLVDPGFTCLNLQQLNLINVMGEITSAIKVKYNTRLSSREPLYSFSAVIAGWLQSTKAQNNAHGSKNRMIHTDGL